MYTTIKISARLKNILDSMKFIEGETYEQLIEDLIEDHLELNPKFKKDIEASFREYKKGNTISLYDVKRKLSG